MSGYSGKYCRVCGAHTTPKPGGVFDQDTGQEIVWRQCATEKCGHSGVAHEYVKVRRKWHLFKEWVCVKCGFCWADLGD